MDVDIHTIRGVMSAVILFAFIALFVWVSLGTRDRFRAAAQLPFADEGDAAAGSDDRAIDEAGEPKT